MEVPSAAPTQVTTGSGSAFGLSRRPKATPAGRKERIRQRQRYTARAQLVLQGIEIPRELVPLAIDEFPAIFIAAACAQVDLSQQTQETGDVDELLVKLAQDENDHQARFDLSMALYGQGQNQLAVDGLLDLFGRAPKWDDDAARKQLLKIFEALGAADPVVVEGRKQLSTLLFS